MDMNAHVTSRRSFSFYMCIYIDMNIYIDINMHMCIYIDINIYIVMNMHM